MDGDALHFRRQLAEYEENIWYSKKHFNEYQVFRDDIRPIWDDSAAKDINNRYLEPNQEDSSAFLDATNSQYQELQEVSGHIQAIGKQFVQANALSGEIADTLVLVDIDLDDAAVSHEASLNVYQNSEFLIQEALSLISKANQII